MTAMMTQKEWTGLARIPKSFSAQTATAETPVITPSQLPRNPVAKGCFFGKACLSPQWHVPLFALSAVTCRQQHSIWTISGDIG